MAVREVIEIDEALCDGCGDCVTACAEGAIAIIDGKARLVSDSYCDGLGACLGHCPQNAIAIIYRDAEAFDAEAVELHLEGIAKPPASMMSVIQPPASPGGGCPGSRAQMLVPASDTGALSDEAAPSRLRHWPVQLHLVPPTAPFFEDADVVLAADCVAYAVGGFHRRFLSGKSLAIACPKLDSNQEIYLQKLVAMIDQAGIRSLQVMVMEVPCCGGLVRLAEMAIGRANRKVPVECLVIGTQGNIIGAHKIAV